MRPFNSLIVAGLLLGAMQAAQAQQTSDLERIHAASRQFVAAIVARDINTMDAVWAHESYASFIGPLSTSVVVGWAGVRQAWQMRFGQFDRVAISMDKPHIRINGEAAWAVGMEKVELLRKDGKRISFDTFVTNVFENQGGQWLLVSPPPLMQIKPALCNFGKSEGLPVWGRVRSSRKRWASRHNPGRHRWIFSKPVGGQERQRQGAERQQLDAQRQRHPLR
jgi:ketosteroid isomerase-like protein